MAAGDVTEAGPYSLPLSSGAKAAIKALYTAVGDHWLVTQDSGKVYFFNIEDA